MIPEYLKSGEPARLMPIVAESSKERRIASITLAVLAKVPELAAQLLSSVGQRVGKRTRIDVYTEVVFADDLESKDRPDGLLVLSNGNRVWRALIEVKVAKGVVEEDQIKRYLELAKKNGIDSVISISNEFVARADHYPIKINGNLTRKVQLFHWPWMWVRTQGHLIQIEESVTDVEQAFLLDEYVRFLEHPSTGVEGFTQMPKQWREVTKVIQAGGTLRRKSDEVEAVVSAWQQEARDLCFILSRHVGRPVRLKLERRFENDPAGWLDNGCAALAETNCLFSTLSVPDTAADLEISVDISRKTIGFSLRLKAPQDKKSTKARMNWLLRQLGKTSAQDVFVKANWPGRAQDTMGSLLALRDNPESIQTDNPSAAPAAFEVFMVRELAGKFSGSRTFIDEVEASLPKFYDEVVQRVRAWQPAPPRPVDRAAATSTAVDESPEDELTDS